MSEASESGCTFVCPQLQSFNASLPTASATSMGAAGLDGSMQATSVVEHKVAIAASLQAEIFLNGRRVEPAAGSGGGGAGGSVAAAMAVFEKNKQVRTELGPCLCILCQNQGIGGKCYSLALKFNGSKTAMAKSRDLASWFMVASGKWGEFTQPILFSWHI